MAAVVTARPVQSGAMRMKRPPQLPSLQTNGHSKSITSPSVPSKRPPSVTPSSAGAALNGGPIVNGTGPRTRPQRRESLRPGQTKGHGKGAGTESPVMERRPLKRKLDEPYVKTTEYILKKFKGKPPSLILHLHPTHFRFDQQDGSFGYTSPMRVILEHIKAQTVPHDMLEELFQSGVPFYDGCLIVEIHDHRTKANASSQRTPGASAGSRNKPCFVHNYNKFITPSPYASYPVFDQNPSRGDGSPSTRIAPTQDGQTVKLDREKENMPAPASLAKIEQRKSANDPKVITTVLHSTPLSLHAEMTIIANTPAPERFNARRQASRDTSTPAMTTPPTPLASLPQTPVTSAGPPNKRQKMLLGEESYHLAQAELIMATETPLYLKPAANLDEVYEIMDLLKHPLHNNRASAPKTRKRTTAELAADEAQAAEEERFMLIMDERLTSSSGVPAGAMGSGAIEGQAGAAPFEPRFNRFKTLENIKMRHEEHERQERLRREDEARRKQQEAEAMQLRRKEFEENQRKQELHRQMMVRRQAEQQAAQQALLQAQAAASMPGHAQNLINSQQHQLSQITQGQHTSPAVRLATPLNMSSSPPMTSVSSDNPNLNSGVGGVPMAATPSNHGGGSPPRPPSAMQHSNSNAAHLAMQRQVSQRQPAQQIGSQHGTPQMAHGTPATVQAVPTTGHMTPQPIVSQGSPVLGGAGQMMMGTPQMNGTQLSSQQRMLLQRQHQFQQQQHLQHQAAFLHQQQLQQHAQSTPQQLHANPGQQMSPQQMSPEQMQMLMQQRQQQMNQQRMMAMAQQQNPQNYQQIMARQMASQMANLQQQQQQQQCNGLSNGLTQNQLTPQQQQQAMINQQRLRLTQQQAQQRALSVSGGQQMAPGMNMNNLNAQQLQRYVQAQAARGGNPHDPAQQQAYLQALHRQRQVLAQRQQMAQAQQQGQQQGGGQALNGLNMMNGVNGMPNGVNGMPNGVNGMPNGVNGMPNGMNGAPGQGRGQGGGMG